MVFIRDAVSDDVEAIVRLVNAAFLVEKFFIERDRTDPEMIRDLMQKGKFLLSEEEEALAGCVYVEVGGDRGYLGMLSVDPERQHRGVGRQLLTAAENYFRDAGCAFSDLRIVDVRTDLLRMYLNWGYQQTGTMPYENRFPTKIPVHFIAMSKPLV